MRKVNICAALTAIAAVVLFFAGKYLQRLYGFDPPYFYFWAGAAAEFASLLFALAFIFLLGLILRRKLKQS